MAMTMATPDANPIEGMQSGVMEIVLTTLGTVTGFVTAGTRFFLKEIDCPDCDGTGNALINRTAFDAASEKLKYSCKKKLRFFKNAWNSMTGGAQTAPLLRPEFCTRCGRSGRRGKIDVSFTTCTSNSKENVFYLSIGGTLLLGLAILSLFFTLPSAVGIIFGGLGTLSVLNVLKNHLQTVNLIDKTGMVTEILTHGYELLATLPIFSKKPRRLAENVDTAGFLGIVGVTIASLVAWYVLFREESKSLPSRRTTIYKKKRPTFFKSQRSTLVARRRKTFPVTQ